MALPDLTGQKVNDTYQRLLQISASGDIVDGTGSLFIPPTAISASYASYAVSASHEIIKEVSSSYADTASLAEELVSDKRATVKGYVYVAHGTTLQSGTTAALYLGTSNAGMDVARYNDNTLVIGGVTQYYGWRIFGIKHGLNSGIYTTEIDNLIATGSINVSGSLDISLASGSAFTITEHDIDQQNRLTFEYDQGDPTLIVASRAGTAKLHLKQDLAGNGVEILNTGVFRRTVSGVSYGFSIATTSLQPNTTNQLDLGYFNRRWKSVYLYTGNKLSWGTVTSTDNVALNNPNATNTLQITGSSAVTLDVKGNIIATGSLGISGSAEIQLPSGSAFIIRENDKSENIDDRLEFEFSDGDPTLRIISQGAGVSTIRLQNEESAPTTGVTINQSGQFKLDDDNGFTIANPSATEFNLSPIVGSPASNTNDLGNNTRPWSNLYVYNGIGYSTGGGGGTFNSKRFNIRGENRNTGLFNYGQMSLQYSGSVTDTLDNPLNHFFGIRLSSDYTPTSIKERLIFSVGKSGSLEININQGKTGMSNPFGPNYTFYTASAMVHVEAEPNYNLDLFRGNNTNGNGVFSVDRDGNISGSDLRVRDGRFQRSPSSAEVEVIGTTDFGLVGTETNDNFLLRRFNITKFTVSESRNVSNQQLHVEGNLNASGILFASASDGAGISHVALYNTSSGQFFYTASSAIGGGGGGSAFPFTGSAGISGSLIVNGPITASGIDVEPLPLINPIVEYDDTSGITSGTEVTLPNGLTYISSSVYEYLEIFVNGLRLRYDRDFIPVTTASVQYELTVPSGSELTYKSLKRPT
jgi:hypothetical protein